MEKFKNLESHVQNENQKLSDLMKTSENIHWSRDLDFRKDSDKKDLS